MVFFHVPMSVPVGDSLRSRDAFTVLPHFCPINMVNFSG